MLLDVARRDPTQQRGELIERLHTVNQGAVDLTEPFQRGTERVRTDEHAGVGLGPAIVGSIVRDHDGTLDLVPGPDGGLVVTVRLPGTTP
ncbi:ATP-binding protein [Micromonospora sp. WMMD737]|uniref:ATP-binding protein n=1 Tax=Micromonospora sp. WMMD737 TaxID=3404113 RepID=UPI003B92B505